MTSQSAASHAHHPLPACVASALRLAAPVCLSGASALGWASELWTRWCLLGATPVAENLTPRAITQAITPWKPDYHRT
ncbi:MAG: hypothetical protein AB1635_01635 [Acidobacteriota bacterium]